MVEGVPEEMEGWWFEEAVVRSRSRAEGEVKMGEKAGLNESKESSSPTPNSASVSSSKERRPATSALWYDDEDFHPSRPILKSTATVRGNPPLSALLIPLSSPRSSP